jgi:transcriptional regulator with XRE-family HTH domain
MLSYTKFIGNAKNSMPRLLLTGRPHTQPGMLTPAQLRAARALVGWSRETLAEKAGVSAQTVTGFELLGADSKISTLNKIRRALETAGVRFIDEDEMEGPGVRLQKGKPASKRK